MSKTTASSTQEHLPIGGIQDGVVIMNDGSVRTILKIEPINFDLKSETEQNGIIYSYQGFLNSLDFPIQIVVQSKKLDLERYLAKLDESKKNITNDLLRIQTEDYVDFVRRLISIANIMSKRFYVAINYSAVTKATTSASFGSMFNHHPTGPILEQEQFERFRAEAFNRANLVAGGLSRLGLRVSILDTQQLIELFYGIYNPDIATEERLTDISNLSAGVVSSFNTFPVDNPPTQEQPEVPAEPLPIQQPAAENPPQEETL
jgi:type IV secretory pathway VirB4 component